MSSRISLTLALALLALTDIIPSAVARVGGETVSQPLNHSMLRTRKLDASKSIAENTKLDVIMRLKWDDAEIPFMSMGSPRNASKDDE
eukprot:scaffold2633_cov139-Skeletonema_menzelii.AAC.3